MKEKVKKFLKALFSHEGLIAYSFILMTAFVVAMLICCISYTPTTPEPSEPDIPTEYTIYLIVQDETKPESEPSNDDSEPEAAQYTEDEIRMIAQLVYAEAENQSELGKRLVIDVVLNRVDHPNSQFPDTVRDVIYQKNQFSPVASGGFDRAYVTDENLQLVREEMERRTDHDVIFFRAGRYGRYGVPMYCVGDHYFSSFD